MDKNEIERIEKYVGEDHDLKTLFEEHKRLDAKLSKLGKQTFLTAEEERQEKELKRLKLLGKDKMMKILEKYR